MSEHPYIRMKMVCGACGESFLAERDDEALHECLPIVQAERDELQENYDTAAAELEFRRAWSFRWKRAAKFYFGWAREFRRRWVHAEAKHSKHVTPLVKELEQVKEWRTADLRNCLALEARIADLERELATARACGHCADCIDRRRGRP